MKIFLRWPVSVQLLHHVWLFATPWTGACQASLSITNSRSLLKLMSIKLVMPSNHLILCRPLLLLPSIFPSVRVFSSGSVLRIKWSKYWSFSFSISPPVGLYRSIAFCLKFMYYFIVWVRHYLYNHSLVRQLDYVQSGELQFLNTHKYIYTHSNIELELLGILKPNTSIPSIYSVSRYTPPHTYIFICSTLHVIFCLILIYVLVLHLFYWLWIRETEGVK